MTWTQRWLRAESTARPRLLVVGGASLDVIHVGGERIATPGGAGLYTALAAARAGAEVTMLAPLPDPMPPELAPAIDLITWVGPRVPLAGLPRFEIAYDDDGAVTFFREHLGAEPDMTPALLDAIDDMAGCAYCVPFLDARLQQAFVRALAARGCRTVAGTYGKAVRRETDVVRETVAIADLFFCNAEEATVLFGSPEAAIAPSGHLRFVTRGSSGATAFQGDHLTEVPGVNVNALDPTGAGDTFCGTTIARLLAGDHPVEATRCGNADPGVMAPFGQAATTGGTWRAAALDDRGNDPYPDPATRVALANAYGRSLASVSASPIDLVEAAIATARPMRALLRLLDHVGGYREDPLRKKAALLGIILRQRPEAWLPTQAGDDAPPIVDYHVQRTALRSGLVSVDDPDLTRRIVAREVLAASDEAAVRRATFAAVLGLAEVSGRAMGAVDWFLFQMRHLCPEMSAPVCADCPARPACAQRVDLFQPVLRTTAYWAAVAQPEPSRAQL